MGAVLIMDAIHSWKCVRCGYVNGYVKDRRGNIRLDKFEQPMVPDKCENCHTGKDRPVRKGRRRGKIGGKRGRNSGKVKSHG